MDDGLFAATAPLVAAPTETVRACPRCGGSLEGERFYGPCIACRDDLRATIVGVATHVEAEAFEPAMHVTPNAVALKD